MSKQKKSKSLQWSIITNLDIAMNSGKYIGEVIVRPNFLYNSIHLILTGMTMNPTRLIYVGNPTPEIRKLFSLKTGKFDRKQRRVL